MSIAIPMKAPQPDPPILLPFLGASLLALAGMPSAAEAQLGDGLRIGGHIQGNPVVISTAFPEPLGEGTWTEYRLQNRLNVRWTPSSNLTLHWQMRTRLFSGDLVRDIPGYADAVHRDDGLINLSWMISEGDDWLLHYLPDRLYAEWSRRDWNVRLGRQRVNWGVNMITNPNDIFNIYSFYDFDYRERPGSDALRVQRFIGFGSRFEVALSPARDLEESVAAALYAFRAGGYDVQVIGGYFRKRITTGAGWAGDFRGAGIKGETMFFADLDETGGHRETNFIASASVDYLFANSLFLTVELLYNHEGGREDFLLMAEELTPDNPSFSRYQATVHLTYPIHPLVDGSLAAMVYPDEEAVFLSPSVTLSVTEDLDFRLLGQVFGGSDDSVFADTGHLVTASLRYHF